MKGLILPGVCLACGVALAYSLGAQQAWAQAPRYCWVLTGYESPEECAPCTGYSCPDCDAGTCPGNMKLCTMESQFELKLEEEGAETLGSEAQHCFYLFACRPAGGAQNCNPPTVGCSIDITIDIEDSETMFPQPIPSGNDCP